MGKRKSKFGQGLMPCTWQENPHTPGLMLHVPYRIIKREPENNY